jgi:hypothetical protein
LAQTNEDKEMHKKDQNTPEQEMYTRTCIFSFALIIHIYFADTIELKYSSQMSDAELIKTKHDNNNTK